MKYLIEKYYPLTLSIILTTLLFTVRSNHSRLIEVADGLPDTSISLSVTLVGFFLTILTIVNSVSSRRMRFVKEGGGMPLLMGYLRLAINCNLILMGSSLLIKYVNCKDFNFFPFSELLLSSLYLFLFIFSILVSVRFTLIFVSLLTDPKSTPE